MSLLKNNKMRNSNQSNTIRKTGHQVIQEKLKDLNESLKTADLSIVYESIEKAKSVNNNFQFCLKLEF